MPLEAKIEFTDTGAVAVERSCRRVAAAQTAVASAAADMSQAEREAARTASRLASEIQSLERKASLERARRSSEEYRRSLAALEAAQGKVAIATERTATTTAKSLALHERMQRFLAASGVNAYVEIARRAIAAAEAIYEFGRAGAHTAEQEAAFRRVDTALADMRSSAQEATASIMDASGALDALAGWAQTTGNALAWVGASMDSLSTYLTGSSQAWREYASAVGSASAPLASMLVLVDKLTADTGAQALIGDAVERLMRAQAEAKRKPKQAAEEDEYIGPGGLIALSQEISDQAEITDAEERQRREAREKAKARSKPTRKATAGAWGEAREGLAAERNMAQIRGMMHDWEGVFSWVDPATQSLRDLATVIGVDLVDAYSRGASEAQAMQATYTSIAVAQAATAKAMAAAEAKKKAALVDGVGQGLAAGRTLALGLIEDTAARAVIEAAYETAEVARSIATGDVWGVINHGIAASLFAATAAKSGGGGGGGSRGQVSAPAQTTLARPMSAAKGEDTGDDRVVVLQLDGRETIRGIMRTANSQATRGLRDTFDLRTVSRSATHRGL